MTQILFQNACLHYLNLPYRWGGDDPMKGFDCSGLVQELLSILGLDPPGDQTAGTLCEYFRQTSRGLIGKTGCGSLVFYGSDYNHLTHVAMMLTEQTIIEAGGGGSKTITVEDASSQNAFVRLRKWDHRKDTFIVVRPHALPW